MTFELSPPSPNTTPTFKLSTDSTSIASLHVEWREPRSHHWYADNRPGLALALKCDRCSQTTLSRLGKWSHQVPLIPRDLKDLLNLCKVSRSPNFPRTYNALHGSQFQGYLH
ncbi:hypothetical protein TNCV_1157261 [Trichonephila clavipes]|nr:hypothetical protein TNCV_1157261 [Trichonephila clavipes]